MSAAAVPAGSEQIAKAFASKEAAAAKAMNYGTVDSRSLAVGGAGAGGGLGLNRPGFGPKVQHFAGARGSLGGISISPVVQEAWAAVLDDKNPSAWVLLNYTPDGKSIELKAAGEGGLKSFKAELGDELAWGGFRCYGVDRRGGLECKRPKFVFVQYKPEAVSMVKKAKMGAHKGDVKAVLTGAHLDINVESMEDLEEQNLITKLQAATGAHKPNGYEFEEGVFVEADFYELGIGKECKGETSSN